MLFVHVIKTKTDKFNQFIKNHVRISFFLMAQICDSSTGPKDQNF